MIIIIISSGGWLGGSVVIKYHNNAIIRMTIKIMIKTNAGISYSYCGCKTSKQDVVFDVIIYQLKINSVHERIINALTQH